VFGGSGSRFSGWRLAVKRFARRSRGAGALVVGPSRLSAGRDLGWVADRTRRVSRHQIGHCPHPTGTDACMRIGDLPVRDARVWTCAPVWPRSARSVSAYATRARAQRRLRSATPIGQEHAPAVAPPTTARGASRVAPLRLQIQQSTRAAPSALLHPRGATLSPETAPSRSNRQHEWPYRLAIGFGRVARGYRHGRSAGRAPGRRIRVDPATASQTTAPRPHAPAAPARGRSRGRSPCIREGTCSASGFCSPRAASATVGVSSSERSRSRK